VNRPRACRCVYQHKAQRIASNLQRFPTGLSLPCRIEAFLNQDFLPACRSIVQVDRVGIGMAHGDLSAGAVLHDIQIARQSFCIVPSARRTDRQHRLAVDHAGQFGEPPRHAIHRHAFEAVQRLEHAVELRGIRVIVINLLRSRAWNKHQIGAQRLQPLNA